MKVVLTGVGFEGRGNNVVPLGIGRGYGLKASAESAPYLRANAANIVTTLLQVKWKMDASKAESLLLEMAKEGSDEILIEGRGGQGSTRDR
jgi:hypothetical protein